MTKPLVVLHGWSDSASGMQALASQLSATLNIQPVGIHLGQYVSMDDHVNLFDLVRALMAAWKDLNLPLDRKGCDVIVHSTGGLLIRAWLSEYFTPQTAPIDHLVMLAPANFGSPLAHKGQSFLGRVLEGFQGNFSVGTHILQALELGSTITWDLAQRDLFSGAYFYTSKNILTTVLIGGGGLSGLAAAANTPGSDGVVRHAGANLNARSLTLDFTKKPVDMHWESACAQVAFGVLPEENHRTIVNKSGGFRDPHTLERIIKALQISSPAFQQWQQELAQITEQTFLDNAKQGGLNTEQYQQICSWVCDDQGRDVEDYFLEWFVQDGQESHWLTTLMHQDVISSVHRYSLNSAYRSIFMDVDRLHCDDRVCQTAISMLLSIVAHPIFKEDAWVGYPEFDRDDGCALEISSKEVQTFFQPHETLLLKFILPRCHRKDLVKFL